LDHDDGSAYRRANHFAQLRRLLLQCP
jgi:hypothetical protein